MIGTGHDVRHESDVLIRQLDGQLASLRAGGDRIDVSLAERVADGLRRLVSETATASAADRARVRAAVHFFLLRHDSHVQRRPARALTEDVRVVNELMHAVGRPDLVILAEVAPAPA